MPINKEGVIMKCIKNSKGYTLVELILVFSICGMIITAIGSHLINNYKFFLKGENQINVQNELQTSINSITNKIMESSGIFEVADLNNHSIIDESTKERIKRISFSVSNGDVVVEHDNANKILYMKVGSNEKVQIGELIENILVQPLNSTYKNSSGIKIELIGNKGDYTVTVNNAVYFRNK